MRYVPENRGGGIKNTNCIGVMHGVFSEFSKYFCFPTYF